MDTLGPQERSYIVSRIELPKAFRGNPRTSNTGSKYKIARNANSWTFTQTDFLSGIIIPGIKAQEIGLTHSSPDSYSCIV